MRMIAQNQRMEVLRSVAEELGDLFFPRSCAFCQQRSIAFCSECQRKMPIQPLQRVLCADFVVTSSYRFDEVSSAVLFGLKERGITDLAHALSPGLVDAIDRARVGKGRVVLVPIPSSARADVSRGYRVIPRMLRSAGLPWCDVLRLRRRTADQRGLSSQQRQQNMSGAFTVSCIPRLQDTAFLLVDDVVTTGATLLAARHALMTAGLPVAGAATAVSTQRHWRSEGLRKK